MTALLWWLAAGLLLVLVGIYPPLAGYLAQLLVLAVGLLLTGATQLLAQPELWVVAAGVYAVVQVRRILRRLA